MKNEQVDRASGSCGCYGRPGRKEILFDAIEAAARDMPEGYAVVLEIEAGAATVRWGRTGEAEYLIDSADCTLAEQINQAVKDALETNWERMTSEP